MNQLFTDPKVRRDLDKRADSDEDGPKGYGAS